MLITKTFCILRQPKVFRNFVRSLVSQIELQRMAELKTPCRSDPVIMTLDTPEFKSIFTEEVETLAKLFKDRNYELRIAGGAVRDMLMGITPKDLDFATDATPTEMKEMFTEAGVRLINHKGEKHGTITSRINDKENFEVTTLRIDVVTHGRRAEVEFTKNWKLDAHRRDLTINSMFLGLDGKVYDYFYGYDDLQKRRIVFVGDPVTRITEDYLRILRYFRFYGRITEKPDDHDEQTLKAIRETAHGLADISGERIWSEWSRILSGRFGGELTLKMIDCGISRYIGLPENPNTKEFQDVYEKLKKNNASLDPAAQVAALLEDYEQGMALHGRLKLSAYSRDMILFLIRYREDIISENPLREYLRIMLNYKGKQPSGRSYVLELLKYKGLFDLANKLEHTEIPNFPVNGHMLKGKVSKPQMMTNVMQKLKDRWLVSDFSMSTDDLMAEVPRIVDELEDRCKFRN